MIKVNLGRAIPYMKGVFGEMQKEFRAQTAKDFGAAINDQIEAGISPVSGQGRFQDYSPSYKALIEKNRTKRALAMEQKVFSENKKGTLNQRLNRAVSAGKKFAALGKRLRPVNLHLTGQMLSTQKVTVDKAGGVKISYSDKKATYHNDTGAGKSQVLRRMLPNRSGEKFSTVLMRMLKNIAANSAARILGR